ncbi:MAG: M23 family metallopeptidase [Bacteroidales bacterium]|jgi:murein DD-endopeptidase MepM/ murein hydrolase activator NlpD|nr:M23 family metallopeptidase [Bacteroidales bacterium]
MAKSKYRFNPETLTYEKIEYSKKHIFGMGFIYLTSFFVLGFTFMLSWLFFFPSVRETDLMDENSELRVQYKVLNSKIHTIENVLEDIADRDNNIYRVIFEADPIPDEIRKAGIGGINRYAEIESKPNMEVVVETAQRLDVLYKMLYVQTLSFDSVINLAKNKEDMLRCIPGIQPLSNNDITRFSSGFGYRIHPIYKTLKMHTGIDLTAPPGTKIYASGDGVVKRARFVRGYGKSVTVSHGYKYESIYAHMSMILVKPGQKVKRGEVVGLVGNTGTSTGPHLHYEIRKNNQPINPINYFLNDLSPQEYDEMIRISLRPTQTLD